MPLMRPRYFRYMVNFNNGELEIAEMYFAYDAPRDLMPEVPLWRHRRN